MFENAVAHSDVHAASAEVESELWDIYDDDDSGANLCSYILAHDHATCASPDMESFCCAACAAE